MPFGFLLAAEPFTGFGNLSTRLFDKLLQLSSFFFLDVACDIPLLTAYLFAQIICKSFHCI